MKLSVPRIPIVSTLSLLLLATVLTLGARSPRHADILGVFTPAGHLAAVASDRGGLLFTATEVPFGPEMGLSADVVSDPADEFAGVHDAMFDKSNEKWHTLGFHAATGVIAQFHFSAWLVPYWALAIPLAILPLTGVRRLVVRVRRKRRGQCLGCGYDLRHTPDRCPECGRPIAGAAAARATSAPDEAASSVARGTSHAFSGVLSWLVVAAVPLTLVLSVVRARGIERVRATAPPEAALFERPVAQLEVEGVPLDRTIDVLARESGARIDPDWSSFAPPEFVRALPCSVHLRDVRLAPVLRAAGAFPRASARTPWTNWVDAQAWAEGQTVRLGLAPVAPRIVRCYPVGDLLGQLQADLDQEAAESQVPSNAQQAGVSNTLFQGGPRSQGPEAAAQTLAELITGTVRPNDWADNGGNLGDLRIGAGRLWVWQTQEGHAAVRSMLAALRTTAGGAASAPDEGEASPHANLAQRIPELNLESATFESAIETIRQSTHANIVVYWSDLESAGVHRDAPVKLHLWDVTLDGALGAVLSVAGGSASGMKGVQDGMIVIATPERLRDSASAVRVYDVRELVEKYRAEGHLPPFEPRRPQGPQSGPGANAVDVAPTFEETVESITRLIEDVVDTDGWKDNGGSIGTIRELGGRLVIGQTPAAHRRILALLDTLRAGGSKEGTDLSRFAH